MRIQHVQGLANEFKVLQCCIRLSPQFRLDDVNAPHGTYPRSLIKRRMIVPAQVALEPHHRVGHGNDLTDLL
jgi:hypothetical protein